MLHVNQESREEGLKLYGGFNFDENKNPSGITYDAGRYIYYNPKIDYIGVKHISCPQSIDGYGKTRSTSFRRAPPPFWDLGYSQTSQYMLRVMAGGRTNYIFPMYHSSKSELVRITEKIETIVPMTYQGLTTSRAMFANHAIMLGHLIREIKDRSNCRMWFENPNVHSVLDKDLIELAIWGSDEEVRRGKKAFDELMVCLPIGLCSYTLPKC
jgi:hypothetical protein